MRKPTVKSFCGAFLKPFTALIAILLMAIICIGSSGLRANTEQPVRGTSLNIPTDNLRTSRKTDANLPVAPKQPVKWKTVKMRVTAYCPCKKCCGRYADGVTACGHKIHPGDVFVAADKQYPFGTEMIIPGYNNAKPVKVLDRGGAISGNRIDVFFHHHQEALNWGVRYLDVKVQQDGQNGSRLAGAR